MPSPSTARHCFPVLLGGLVSLLAACSGEQAYAPGADLSLTGTVRVDGSSTVFPISEALAEEFRLVAPNVRVTVGSSGTGGGFNKFLAGEVDINDASRDIGDEEKTLAAANGLEYLEIPVAFDGLSVVVNPRNTWVDYLTVAELKKIWEPGSTVDSWNDVRPGWPDSPLRLYGPGTDSGTFEYFTETVVGAPYAARPDYTASENDNILVQGVAGDEGALGFFGFAYYENSASQLRLVPVDGGNGPVAPTVNTINDGSYSPLSRPLFIYVSKTSAARPEVRAFVDFYLETASLLVTEVGYVPLRPEQYTEVAEAFDNFR